MRGRRRSLTLGCGDGGEEIVVRVVMVVVKARVFGSVSVDKLSQV